MLRLTILILLICPILGYGQLGISVESGFVFSQYNNVQAPNGSTEQGTRFSLKDDFKEIDRPIYLRVEAKYLIKNKHTIELTAAPLTVSSRNFQPAVLRFEEEVYMGNNINGRYQFNTYRASYRYRIIDNDKFTTDLGATFLVRDAEIRIFQDQLISRNTDLGFVPLVSFDVRYLAIPKFQIVLKGDALVGQQGRAEDIFLGANYDLSSKLAWKLGYRVIEGGADVEQVYNFAFFHFAATGLTFSF
ncbi:MAG: hypothetical protein AAF573_17615 [Bacteroidota bacterium]